MDPIFSKTLAAATVQEIQLELLRRTRFNALDGERIVTSLLARRDLWEAVMLDRLSLSRPGALPTMGLIKLRDLPENLWNADTLYVLTPDAASARKLAKIVEDDDWGGMCSVYDDEKIYDALGSGREKRAIVTVWWD
jgi:hypothetical protein